MSCLFQAIIDQSYFRGKVYKKKKKKGEATDIKVLCPSQTDSVKHIPQFIRGTNKKFAKLNRCKKVRKAG